MRKRPIVATVVISAIFMCLAGCERSSISNSSSTGSTETTPSITTDTSTDSSTSSSQGEKSYFESLNPNKPTLVSDDDKTMKVTITNENASHSSSDTSESDSTTSDTSTSDSRTSDSSLKSYYSPSEVTLSKTIADYSQENYASWHYTPSLGKVPLLVIPIVVPTFEDEATEDNMNLIKKAFGGDDLNYESLYSYYYQSSYGQLSFDITVTDYFVMSKNSTIKRKKKFESSFSNVTKVCKEALTFMTERYDLDLTDYDSDDDGCLDGVWFIYIARTYTPYNSASQDIYWGFTTTTQEVGTIESPVLNTYGWAGIDFLNGTNVEYNLSKEDNPDSECDAHVLIHETGHMLGLADYYSYNSSSTYSPLGKIDMMDNNVGDHNPFSKMLLGWIKPYVVTGTSATITLDTSLAKDSVILISYDDKKYGFDEDGRLILNIFDEYILIDYYSPKGLNENSYEPYSVDPIKDYGCRIYHVDNRLGKLIQSKIDPLYDQYTYSIEMPSDPDEYITGDYDDTTTWIRVISNSESGDNSETTWKQYGLNELDAYFDEIRWISADGSKINKKSSNKNRLFLSEGTFSLSDFSSQFHNGKLDNGKTFSSVVRFG